MPPSIVDFDHLRDFLNAYAAHQRSTSRDWTLETWAQTLGLKNKGTISRLLSGEREASPELLERLKAHFAFDEREREYFALLAVLSSPTLGASVTAALRAELARTRTLIVAGPENDDLLRIDDGTLFSLHGQGDVARANAFLAPQRLVASPFVGKAMVTLSIADYTVTNLGPYAEGHVTVLAYPAGADMTEMGLAFSHHRCNRAHIASLGHLAYGNGYAVEELSLRLDGTRFEADGQLFRASVDSSLPSDPFQLETWGFPSELGGRARIKFRIDGKRKEAPVSDALQWSIPSPMREFLDDLSFEVQAFSIVTELRTRVSLPVPLG